MSNAALDKFIKVCSINQKVFINHKWFFYCFYLQCFSLKNFSIHAIWWFVRLLIFLYGTFNKSKTSLICVFPHDLRTWYAETSWSTLCPAETSPSPFSTVSIQWPGCLFHPSAPQLNPWWGDITKTFFFLPVHFSEPAGSWWTQLDN